MKYSVRTRVSGGEIGSHDTLWDQAKIIEGGWLHVWNLETTYVKTARDPKVPGQIGEDGLGRPVFGDIYPGRPIARVTEERMYPPTSIYSVKPIDVPPDASAVPTTAS